MFSISKQRKTLFRKAFSNYKQSKVKESGGELEVNDLDYGIEEPPSLPWKIRSLFEIADFI